jgi:hypothetical protein
MSQSDVTSAIRRYLLLTLAVGMAGMTTELLLIGHVESVQQLIPVVLLGLGAAVLAWHGAAPRAITVRTLQVTMVLFLLSGLVGVSLHYRGNLEFELEMYPSMRGFEMIQKTLTGATPVLAPGSMALLGLIGLTYSYRHPCLDTDTQSSRDAEGES